jgi:hypothetical protein
VGSLLAASLVEVTSTEGSGGASGDVSEGAFDFGADEVIGSGGDESALDGGWDSLEAGEAVECEEASMDVSGSESIAAASPNRLPLSLNFMGGGAAERLGGRPVVESDESRTSIFSGSGPAGSGT